MILEALLSTVGGGLLRMAPEFLKFFDRKDERKHELSLQDKQIELAKLQQQGQLAVADVNATQAMQTGWLDAVREIAVAQAKPTGIKWVDAVSATVRPFVTYLLVLMWILAKVAAYAQLDDGLKWSEAVLAIWGPEDHVIFSGTLSFWFVSRALEKYK